MIQTDEEQGARRVARSEPGMVEAWRRMARSWGSEGVGEGREPAYPATDPPLTVQEACPLPSGIWAGMQLGWHRSHLSPRTDGLLFLYLNNTGVGVPGLPAER